MPAGREPAGVLPSERSLLPGGMERPVVSLPDQIEDKRFGPGFPRIEESVAGRPTPPCRGRAYADEKVLQGLEVQGRRLGSEETGGGVVATGDRRPEVVRAAMKVARKQDSASLRIQRADGRIQEERTYPRSSDPRGSKG
jgi:hypothetical protein